MTYQASVSAMFKSGKTLATKLLTLSGIPAQDTIINWLIVKRAVTYKTSWPAHDKQHERRDQVQYEQRSGRQ